MSTIPAPESAPDTVDDEQDVAHSAALQSLADIRYLHTHRHALYGALPQRFSYLVGAGLVGITGLEARSSWWITSRGLDVRDTAVETETASGYRLSWRQDGAERETLPGLHLDDARQIVATLIASLRGGYRVSRVTVWNEAGVNVTDAAARGLIPHAEELTRLAHRASTIAGLRDLTDFLAARPSLPVPALPALTNWVDAADNGAGRNAVYVAAAALNAEPVTHDDAVLAVRDFGPVRYQVAYLLQTEPDSPPPATFHPGTAPIGWTANADGGARS